MATDGKDPLLPIAELVADRIAENGYAFVEDSQLGGLAVAIHSFLTTAGISINGESEAGTSGGGRGSVELPPPVAVYPGDRRLAAG